MHPADFPLLGLLLFVASLVAIVTRRLQLPYSAGLVAAGLALALLPLGLQVALTPELVFTIFLPPLIFEAAIQIPWAPLRRELPLLLLLVTIGVLLAAGVVAAGMHWLIGWSWLGAAFFGILVAATDPVSVIAMFRDVPVPPRLHLLVEAESLLNDGVAAVGFVILVAIAGGAAATLPAIGAKLFVTAFGGMAAGGLVALPLLLIAGRTEDRLVEITLTTLAAFGSFLLAEHFHLSGVLAGLTAGLIVGNVGWMGSISDSSRPNILAFWEYAAFLANSIIFILIGAAMAGTPILPVVEAAGAAILLSLLGRAATIYPVAALFGRSSLRLAAAWQHVLWWGGLRGALALALALALPANVAERDQIVAVVFAVVAFSVFVQGLTMGPLVKRLGLFAARAAGD
ncbi:MAG: monovalent cation:H+ antiporter, family [Sphingomonadales bacterium]|nr:monovalent cation:H+ antiporter, family [Sphingomonadales bacterium]